ncbi:MAG: Ni,Fe-hydrogenase cytochrome b subunit [Pedobacter sp.]|jgi:Ni/Fe-hydrogenase 1 B-type cytochrome subunit|nr:Ni,Fe-hydrogenase cytochrome b subunit [Pedobacter sp.]
MSNIEPLRHDIEFPGMLKKNSRNIRLWHWLNAIVISGSLITVLVNSTILDVRANTSFVKNEVQKSGISISDLQAKSAVHALEDKVWSVHIIFGYLLAALLAYRIISEFLQHRDQKFIKKLKAVYGKSTVLGESKTLMAHERFVKTLYAIFYLLVFTMVITGLTLAFKDDLQLSRNTAGFIKEIHGFCLYPIIGFIIIHIAGVILAESKDEKGIVSDMIHGGAHSPATSKKHQH